MRKFKIKLTDKNYYIIYADNHENAVKKLRDALINNEISDYQPKELSNSKIEAIPAQAREELNNSNNKRATLLGYESYIEDIIEAADPSIKGSLKSRGNKIISDLKKQFKIEDNEIKDDNNSEYKKELAYWQDLYMNRKLITSSELSAKAAELRKKYNIKDAELTSMNIIEKAKSLGGQVKQNGATGVLGISITSPQRSDEFADWLEENNIHYNSDGRQYYVEIKDSAIKDGKYVINNMNDLKRLFTNFPKGDVDISYGRSGFYYHIRPKADGKVSLGSAGYDGTFNTLKEALEWVVYNFRDLILNVNPDGSNRDSAIKDASRNDCRLVLAARGFMPLKENSDHTETWRFRGDNLKDFQKQVYEVRMRYPHLIESSSDTRLEIYVDYEWAARDSAIKDADNRIFELGNKRQVVFSTGNFVAMENGVVYDKGFLGGSKYNNGKGWNVDDYIKHLKSLGYKEVNDSAIEDSTDEDYTNSTYTNGNYTLKILNKVKPGEYGVNNAYNVEWNGNKQKLSAEGISMVIRNNKMHKISDSAIKDDLSKVENIGKFTLWKDNDTKEYYFDATISRSGKKLHPLGTTDINKAREKVKKELEWITDSAINDAELKDGTCKVSSNDFGVATMFGPKSKEDLERLARVNEKVYLEYEVNGRNRGFWKAASSLLRQLNSGTMRIIKVYDSAIKDSSDYTINYRNSYTGERNKETIKANSAIEAIKKFADAVALRGWGTRNIDIISISPNDGYVRLYGSLQALLASKEFRDCNVTMDANPLKEDFYQINSKRFNKIKENINLGKLTKESALQYIEKMWGTKEPGSAIYLKNWIKEDIKDCNSIKDSNELDKYVGKRLKSANDFLTYVEIASNNNYKWSNNSDGTMNVVIPSGIYNIKFKYDREPDKNGDRVQVDKITKISDAEPKNWTYVMFGTTGEKKVDNLTKAEAEHLLKNNKLLGYDGKIFETNLVKDAITYGITPEFKWRKGDIKPERIAYTLDEARYVKDSLERTDRIIYVIFEIETNKIVY